MTNRTKTAERRETLKSIYMDVWGNFAMDTNEIAAEYFGGNCDKARDALNHMADLVCGEMYRDRNGDLHDTKRRAGFGAVICWQAHESYDYIDEDEAVALFDKWAAEAGYPVPVDAAKEAEEPTAQEQDVDAEIEAAKEAVYAAMKSVRIADNALNEALTALNRAKKRAQPKPKAETPEWPRNLDPDQLNQEMEDAEIEMDEAGRNTAAWREAGRRLNALKVEYSRRRLPEDNTDLRVAHEHAKRDAGAAGHATAHWGRVRLEAIAIAARERGMVL